MDTDIPLHPMPEDKYGTLIMQLNGPETVAGLQHLKMTRGRQWHTIGYWAWELPVFPKGWDRAFPFLSEIWAVSEFTAKAIRSHEAAPTVSVFGHAVLPPPTVASDRAKFGLPKDAFIFLTLADSMSSLNRKNPFTAIAAHKAAFHGDEDVHLVIKTRNLGRSASAKADLLAAIGDAENIHVMDQSLSPQARWDLFGTSDCIISLHRSEGFGLALAEAMALQKPVIATAWSGNMDFTTPENAYLADFTLVPCEDNYGVYNDSSTVWADVSVEEAARLMREVYTKPKARKARAKAGRTYIKDSASPKRLGEKFAQRLKDLS